jgi:hypothetical protein
MKSVKVKSYEKIAGNYKMSIAKMDDALFVQRRKIIEHLYRARELSKKELPWIKVRISKITNQKSPESVIYGLSIHQNEIHISEEILKLSDLDLKYTVFHELVHEYFKVGHVKNPKDLMFHIHHSLTSAEIERDFVKYSKL